MQDYKNNFNEESNITQPNSSDTEEAPTDKKIYINDVATGALRCLSLNKNGEQKSELISKSYIKVVALTRTEESSEWNTRIEFRNRDSVMRELDIPCSVLLDPKEPLKLLADAGFDINCDRKRLIEYLISYNPTQRVIQIKCNGWISNELNTSVLTYICPSFIVGNTDENNTYSLNDGNNNYGFTKKGTFSEWQENVCRYCENNRVLTLAVCVSFAGPLLRFLPQIGTTIVNLIGKSSIGKTTALNVAGSMWGSSKFIQQWRTTSNALEFVSEMHNEGLLILDELSQVSSKDIGNIIYMLGNEHGKNRMTSDINTRKSKEWRMSILSSGEIGIVDKIEEEKGTKVQAGQLVRCIDIDVQVHEEYGIYDDLHNFKSGAELSNYLKEAASKYYGTASEAFIKRLVEDPTANQPAEETVKKTYDDMRNNIYEKFNLEGTDGQVQRVADVFAMFIAVGIEASIDNFGILTHKPEVIEEVIFATFRSWLEDKGGSISFEEQNLVEELKNFIAQNEHRFYKGNSESEKIFNPLGFVEIGGKETVYRIYPSLFKKEFCAANGFGIKIARKILSKHGLLKLDPSNKDPYVYKIKGKMTTIVIKNLSPEIIAELRESE